LVGIPKFYKINLLWHFLEDEFDDVEMYDISYVYNCITHVNPPIAVLLAVERVTKEVENLSISAPLVRAQICTARWRSVSTSPTSYNCSSKDTVNSAAKGKEKCTKHLVKLNIDQCQYIITTAWVVARKLKHPTHTYFSLQ